MRLMMVGDLVLDEPDALGFFNLARSALAEADVLIGHVEVPHTTRGDESVGDVPAPASDPENLKALGGAGFHIATLAGNHIHDRGADGIADTIDGLTRQGIATAGAGANLDAARRPAIVAAKGLRVGVLSYNCVGPAAGWATADRAGCAFVRLLGPDGEQMANPGDPKAGEAQPDPASLALMQADIARLRGQVDVLIASFHKGIVHTPAFIAAYERPVSQAAIEAGADIVIGGHAHILRGVDIYRGKPIFHGLGNFVTVTHALNVEGNDSPARRAWAEKRKILFGFEPDPAYPLYPFHPESKNAMIADCAVAADGTISAGFQPCWILPSGQPEVLGRGPRGEAVADYVAKITREAGLTAEFAWDGDRVVFG
jgi:poly-gamma-glutamate capsule biosynthesis protein CapA/YwtB (metallophosphatase superfamily)